MSTPHPAPQNVPEHLSGPARRWWLQMVETYEGLTTDPDAQATLTAAAVQMMRAEQFREDIQNRGAVVANRFGVMVENPACPGERAAMNLHQLLVRELNLGSEDRDEANRLPRLAKGVA